MSILNIFKKKKQMYKRFGRYIKIGERAKCDVCGGNITLGDYIYLCRECRDKLPDFLKQNHHLIVDFPDARKKLLKHFIDTEVKL